MQSNSWNMKLKKPLRKQSKKTELENKQDNHRPNRGVILISRVSERKKKHRGQEAINKITKRKGP